MAHQRRADLNGQRTNGTSHGEFEAPPSTMAAQLISNIAEGNKPSRSSERDELQRLMSEISQIESQGPSFRDADEQIRHAHKLIYVLTRTLLERLSQEDPFLNLPEVVAHAADALDVFVTTIKETPAVLTYVSPVGERLQGRGEESLWLWLFPRTIRLLGLTKCEDLTEKINNLLLVCFQVVAQLPQLWWLSSAFFTYLKDCITSLQGQLSTPVSLSDKSSVNWNIPAGISDSLSLLHAQHNLMLENVTISYQVCSINHGVCQISQLLVLLAKAMEEAAFLHDATYAFHDYSLWAVDTFAATNELQKRRCSISKANLAENISFVLLTGLVTLSRPIYAVGLAVLWQKYHVILADVLVGLLQFHPDSVSNANQVLLARALLLAAQAGRNEVSIQQLMRTRVRTVLEGIMKEELRFSFWDRDLKKTITLFCESLGLQLPQSMIESKQEPFEDASLLDDLNRLGISHDTATAASHEDGPPFKRRKTSQPSPSSVPIINELYAVLSGQTADDLDGLRIIASDCYATLQEQERCHVIQLLGLLPCALQGKLKYQDKGRHSISETSCCACDDFGNATLKDLDGDQNTEQGLEAISILEKIVQTPQFVDSRRPRVLAMIAFRRYLQHFKFPEVLNLDNSVLGQWCLRSLKSSTRELRIVAGRVIPFFCCKNALTKDAVKKYSITIMGVLHTCRDAEPVTVQETCVLTWGQLGRTLNDTSLVFALLELVNYLGHTNTVVSGAAYSEILTLAEAREVSVRELFSPYWDVIAYHAVKDLIVRPQTTQYMADLLDLSVTDFLLLTQAYSLPYLVLNQSLDIIHRISQARQDHERWLVLFEASNLNKILALLLQQSFPDIETTIISLLAAYDKEFKDKDLVDLMKIEPANTAFYLLMAASEADDAVKSRVRYGLTILASHAPIGEGSQSKKNKVGTFLEQHVLGLATRLIDVITASRTPYSIVERERAIRGVEELVRVAKSHSRVARPHLSSCLQLAISTPRSQHCAMSAWSAMLRDLEDEDVEAMLESTFSIIIQHWNQFDEETRTIAYDTLKYLMKHRTRLIRMSIVNLPSLAQLEPLEDIEKELQKLRTPTDTSNALQIFSRRVRNENFGVVSQALTELKDFLLDAQSFIHSSAVSDQPDPVVGILIRSVLDTCVKFNKAQPTIAQLSAECIGLIGCLDSNRVESPREQQEIVVVSNFNESDETTDFVLYTLQYILVPVFLSTQDSISQGFFSYSMQQLLDVSDFKRVCGIPLRSGQRSSSEPQMEKWQSLPPNIQHTLTPFLTSKYSVNEMKRSKVEYPIFTAVTRSNQRNVSNDKLYGVWLRTFASDLLSKPFTIHAQIVFGALSRAIRIRDTTVAHFLLPYLVLHVILAGTKANREEIGNELLSILNYQVPPNSKAIRHEEWKSCLECVFRVLDYLSRWVQERQLKSNQSRGTNWQGEVDTVRSVISRIPAEILTQGALECRSYSRALFYWEQHIRSEKAKGIDEDHDTVLLERMQDIYSQIDEPDGIEGISAQLHVLDIEQQIIGHQKAGRWTAAQTWYEIKLAEQPEDVDIQVNLLNCLKESGQHDVLLNYVEGMKSSTSSVSRLLPYATEASWATNRWAALEKYTSMTDEGSRDDFNVRIGQALLALQKDRSSTSDFKTIVDSIRHDIAGSVSAPNTASVAASHDVLLRLHVLTELEMIAGTDQSGILDPSRIVACLNRRLEVLGSYLNDKQYLLGIRRATMKLSSLGFGEEDISEAWLTSARLARKGNAIHQSFNAVLHASQLGDSSATIEHARLIWKEGNHRKAIGILEGAIKSNAFVQHNRSFQSTTFATEIEQNGEQNLHKARAYLMLAKWQDAAGQTNSATLRQQYQEAARTHINWEKGHYYLGRHYNKLLDSEKLLPPEQQKEAFLGGEAAKMVIENYLRSMSFGTKYLYQTLPRIITLWLDLATQVSQPMDSKFGQSKEHVTRINSQRKQNLDALHSRFTKYISKVPAYMFYTALPQIMSRIAHPNAEASKVLTGIIVKVIVAFPQHTLWNLLAVCTSNQSDRKTRGMGVLSILQKKNEKKADTDVDIRMAIRQGVKLTNELIPACNAGEFPNNRTSFGSLSRDLNFNTKACTPNHLVVPFEQMLTISLPTLTDNVRGHKAFSNDIVTIQSFNDNVMILSSLQKPRKLTAVGSDGRQYGLMCKPKDDLRKDQRLMEFNSMINRALKRDAESSRRQLYIKTYAVTPLNEECGLIEWVDGLKTLRDILLALLKSMGISLQYKDIEYWCEQALVPDKTDKHISLFQAKVLDKYPPVFHKWFVQQFPEPSAWFASRIRYTRSCAVMSMVGTILGLGDRHGENILFEEGNGGTFHVDFNCLFDKGLTFAKPEQVPFRLTHNMTDAMGMYNYEGPFRKSSELTLKLLRQHEETLMTIMEAFVYDPTLDLLNKKPEKRRKEGVPQTGQGVLDSIQRKVKGYLKDETVPLGVEGHVEELIKMATNHTYLASMYIGWCSFL